MDEALGMELTLEDIFMILRKRWLLIVSFVIIGIVGAGAYTYFTYVPMYSTSTTVLVNRQDVTSGMSSSSDYYIREDLLSTFQGIINSSKLRTEVEKRIGDQTLGVISVSADDSSIIRINSRHNNPELAAEVANTTAIVFQEMIKSMMYDMDSSILDEATVNIFPQGMNLKIKVIIGGILGGMMSVGLCFVIEFLDKTFKSPKELELALELPVVGVIPEFNLN